VSLLGDLAAAVQAQVAIEARVEELARHALVDGASRAEVARVLGVCRATLYRQYADSLARPEEPGEGASGRDVVEL
jgi:transposase-like protein